MLVAMELVYRVHSPWGSLERFASPPLGVLTALALGGWSALVAGASGLSDRAWIGLWIAAGLAAVVAGLTYSTIPDLAWAVPLQRPSAIILLAALALAARRTAQLVAHGRPPSAGRRSLLVFILATAVVASMELRLWLLTTPN